MIREVNFADRPWIFVACWAVVFAYCIGAFFFAWLSAAMENERMWLAEQRHKREI